MAGRRGWGEDSIYFDHSGECRDPDNHRHCPGRWRGVVSLKSGHAEASEKVRRNVAALIDSPSGRQGRPSRSLTFEQAVALITAAQEYALYAYVVLSLLVGLRTEEARALPWDHVHLDADSDLPRTSMCGALYGPTGTSRPASPGAPSRCRRWP